MHVGTREELIVTVLQRTKLFRGLGHGGRKQVEQGGIQFHPHIRQNESSIRRFPARKKKHVPYQNYTWTSGRVSSEASFDVCIGEGSQILIRFGGAVGQGVVRGVVSVMVRKF